MLRFSRYLLRFESVFVHKFHIVLLCLFLVPKPLWSQILPPDGSNLNYRLIGFRFPSVPLAKNYKLEIASGNFISADSFKKNVIKTIPCKKSSVIAEVPSFGNQYTWRFSYSVNNDTIYSSLHHFCTVSSAEVDTNSTRFRIVKHALKYKGDYVFLDGNRALYDMNGKPVWYLPDIYGSMNKGDLLSDLKFSSHNTITFIFEYQAYEINYDGKVLWKGPNNGKVSGDSVEFYHHEFTHLNNGHYMVLGSEFNWKFPLGDNSLHLDPDNDIQQNEANRKVEFGTIIEYDKKGNVVWSWKSSNYFLAEDTNYIKPPQRHFTANDFDFIHPNIRLLQHDVHENAFFFDEKTKVVYLSFKNVSRIIKLKYPEGVVLNTYGPIQKPGSSETGINLFCHQHSCRISKDGYLYLFNNNLCDTSGAKITMLQEPVSAKTTLKKIWEYQCTVEDNYKKRFTSGGNVIELSDRSLFVNMGSDYSKVFIVNRDKKVLWSAIPEKWNPAEKNWTIIHQYRASIISKSDLENLIWNSESKE